MDRAVTQARKVGSCPFAVPISIASGKLLTFSEFRVLFFFSCLIEGLKWRLKDFCLFLDFLRSERVSVLPIAVSSAQQRAWHVV